VFRVEIVAGTELICAGESNCAPLVSKIATLIDTLTRMQMSDELHHLLSRSDHLIDDICRHLLDMVPEETNSVQSLLVNLQNTVQLLQSLWYKLRTKLTAVVDMDHTDDDKHWSKDQGVRVGTEFSADVETQITHFSSQLRSLVQQLVAKSCEAARKYKAMLFAKTCTRLNFAHFSSTKALHHTPLINFASISPSSLSLDLHAYFFICQSKRLCFCHIPAKNRHEFNMALVGALEKASLQRLSVAKLSQTDPSDDMLTILITNTTTMQTSSKNFSKAKMRSVWGTLTKKAIRREKFDFGEIPEPVWCLALFDSYIHKDLAVAQTLRLATELYHRTTLVQWSFR
uniref:Uncharacterized protein n=1 Tax=Plectus sambesii TaxID=2011161 RepID=A0A914V0L7_9BILA